MSNMEHSKWKFIKEKWYIFLCAAVILGQAAVFLFFGENSYIAVHDNLDLFMGHFQAMNHANAFWGENMTVPVLGGVTRDCFSSEFSLYNILYWLMPGTAGGSVSVLTPFMAYMCGYFLKILIALFSVNLLAKDIYGEHVCRPAAWICGLIYGLLPLFPTYGIAFASIPLVIVLLRRIYRGEGRWNYLLLFLYPLLSYFSYFGFFILAYLAAAILILWVRDAAAARHERQMGSFAADRKERHTETQGSARQEVGLKKRALSALSLRLVIALFVLALGYIVWEYRLFREMLFSDVVSMRSTMADDNFTAGQILASIREVFTQAIFHAQPSHTRFVLPVCMIFYAYHVVCWLRQRISVRKHRLRKIETETMQTTASQAKTAATLTDGFCLTMYLIVFNCIIYGFYYWEGFRTLFVTLVPQLEGFQYNRTVFFNPLLWYAALFFVVKYLYERSRKRIGNLLLVIALAVVMLTPAVYNDFYYTCYYHAYRILKNTEVENLNYREFFSEDLFAQIKEEIGYDGEYSVAYGLHPAVLSYNGIATLDGYLGFYSQQYKEDFGAMIAPATERVEEWNTYFWDWGARAYLFSGSGENTWNAVRTMTVSDKNLYIDGDQFRRMGGTWIFSRMEIENEDALGLELKGVYADEPYTIYVYCNQ